MASSVFLCRLTLPAQTGIITAAATGSSTSKSSGIVPAIVSKNSSSSSSSRRGLLAGTVILLLTSHQQQQAALANVLDDYKAETQAVIQKVKQTLSMDKTNPDKPQAVASLRRASNEWVARYRREKSISGKPSYSNIYSVLNAISGHYISFGPSSTIPAKRQQRILEEVDTAAKALERGR